MALTKILMVVAPEQYRDEELDVPSMAFRAQPDWQVVVASTRTGTATGMLGGSMPIDVTLDEASMNDYAAIVVVGGMGSPQYLWENATLHQLLQQAANEEKPIGAICLSGAVLGKAGVLKGRKATVWATDESVAAIRQGGGEYIEEPVVTDGTIVTACGPHAAEEFARRLVQLIDASVGSLSSAEL